MAKTRKVITALTMLTAVILLMIIGGCQKSDSTPTPPRTTTYSLKVKDVLEAISSCSGWSRSGTTLT